MLKLGREIKHLEVWVTLKDRVDQVKAILPLIVDLKNPALRPRHWSQLQEEVGKPFGKPISPSPLFFSFSFPFPLCLSLLQIRTRRILHWIHSPPWEWTHLLRLLVSCPCLPRKSLQLRSPFMPLRSSGAISTWRVSACSTYIFSIAIHFPHFF